MNVKIISLFIIGFSIYTISCSRSSQKPNSVSVSENVIERWYRVNDTIVYAQIDLSNNDSLLLQKKYAVNSNDSSFVFGDRKIYLFSDASKLAKFSNAEQYFDNHLPSINIDIEITLWISAIIDKNGKPEHVGIVREPSYYSYILPTIDVVKKMPNWSPAHIGDEKVASLVMFPVHHKVK